MTHAAQLRIDRKPAAWLVAGGILAAITMSLSCLAILVR
ncbi:MAG: hypothetical protein JWM57_2606 [Phycisphaerales bacterium]|nr:hypothetical protein [Phycisphaerales bacterium]